MFILFLFSSLIECDMMMHILSHDACSFIFDMIHFSSLFFYLIPDVYLLSDLFYQQFG